MIPSDDATTTTNQRSQSRGPLAGVKVLEMEAIGPVPFTGMLMADMGADIIRIVRAGSAAPSAQDIDLRGRCTVAADLKSPEGRQTVSELSGYADILLEGFRPGVMERLQLGPDALLKANPRLIYGRMTGWGQQGPRANAAGHDINYIALTGVLASIGSASEPTPPLNLVGDFGGGAMFLLSGVLAALHERSVSGHGQVVDAAMCDGALSMMTPFHLRRQRGEWNEERASNLLDGGTPFYATYRCKDEKFIAVGALEPKFFRSFAEVIGLTPGQITAQNEPDTWSAMKAHLTRIFRTRDRDEWCALFAGRDACIAPVLSLDETLHDNHLRERDAFTNVNGFKVPSPAPRFSRTLSEIISVDTRIRTAAEARNVWSQADSLPLR